jgi:hypothetical protein
MALRIKHEGEKKGGWREREGANNKDIDKDKRQGQKTKTGQRQDNG